MSNQKQADTSSTLIPQVDDLLKKNSTAAIMKILCEKLFNEPFSFANFFGISLNFVIALAALAAANNPKAIMDFIDIRNSKFLRFQIQQRRLSKRSIRLVRKGPNWYYSQPKGNVGETEEIQISLELIANSYLSKKSILVEQPNRYYYTYSANQIRVDVSDDDIVFAYPAIDRISDHLINEVILKHKVNPNYSTTVCRNVPSSITTRFEPISSIINSYETDIYKVLCNMLVNHFAASSVLTTPYPSVMCFDGPPGTGKTTFGHHVAKKDIFTHIILYNMMSCKNDSLATIVTNTEKGMTSLTNKKIGTSDKKETILIIFDEVDKWLANYIDNSISESREQSRRSTKNKDDKGTVTSEDNYVRLTPEEEQDKRHQLKCDALNVIYDIAEGKYFVNGDKKYVIIFNTNNFDTLFEGCNDHFKAHRSRITTINFELVNRENLIKYLKFFFGKFAEESKRLSIESKTNELGNIDYNVDNIDFSIIPPEITISYREIYEIFKLCSYDPAKVVQTIAVKKDQTFGSNAYKLTDI